jgi:hypothetical protein
MRESGPVAEMFRSMIEAGHLTPVTAMEDLRLPGELASVPSYVTYGTPEVPANLGSGLNAELGYRPQRDRVTADNK